jgi:hypothetical protein
LLAGNRLVNHSEEVKLDNSPVAQSDHDNQCGQAGNCAPRKWAAAFWRRRKVFGSLRTFTFAPGGRRLGCRRTTRFLIAKSWFCAAGRLGRARTAPRLANINRRGRRRFDALTARRVNMWGGPNLRGCRSR